MAIRAISSVCKGIGGAGTIAFGIVEISFSRAFGALVFSRPYAV